MLELVLWLATLYALASIIGVFAAGVRLLASERGGGWLTRRRAKIVFAASLVGIALIPVLGLLVDLEFGSFAPVE